MPRRADKTAQFTLRLPQDLKERLEASALKQDIDGVVWIRHAIREKLDRENSGLTDDELDARIEAVLKRLLEKRGRGE